MPKRVLTQENGTNCHPEVKHAKQITFKYVCSELDNLQEKGEINLETLEKKETHKSHGKKSVAALKRIKGTLKLTAGTLDDFLNCLHHLQSVRGNEEKGPIYHLKHARIASHFTLTSHSETDLRFPYDLPEMYTFCLCDRGRYALWIDDIDNISSQEMLIVHAADDEHLPNIQVVGDRFEHLLYHLADGDVSLFKDLLPKTSKLDLLPQEIQEVIEKRKKKKLGNLPNGLGIWVPQETINGVLIGYRDLGTSTAELKKTLLTIATHKSKAVRNKETEKITELSAYVNMANDERDFGMGLEFGHWLWLANDPSLDKLAERYLKMAYLLLKRPSHIEFLEAISKARKLLREAKTQE